MIEENCVCYVHPLTGKSSTRPRPQGCPVHSETVEVEDYILKHLFGG